MYTLKVSQAQVLSVMCDDTWRMACVLLCTSNVMQFLIHSQITNIGTRDT